MTEVCLGCGSQCEQQHTCPGCYARLVRCIDVFGYWPMEVSLSPAALLHVETAIRDYLTSVDLTGQPRQELANAANLIRAFLQHQSASSGGYTPAAAQVATLPGRSEKAESWMDE